MPVYTCVLGCISKCFQLNFCEYHVSNESITAPLFFSLLSPPVCTPQFLMVGFYLKLRNVQICVTEAQHRSCMLSQPLASKCLTFLIISTLMQPHSWVLCKNRPQNAAFVGECHHVSHQCSSASCPLTCLPQATGTRVFPRMSDGVRAHICCSLTQFVSFERPRKPGGDLYLCDDQTPPMLGWWAGSRQVKGINAGRKKGKTGKKLLAAGWWRCSCLYTVI